MCARGERVRVYAGVLGVRGSRWWVGRPMAAVYQRGQPRRLTHGNVRSDSTRGGGLVRRAVHEAEGERERREGNVVVEPQVLLPRVVAVELEQRVVFVGLGREHEEVGRLDHVLVGVGALVVVLLGVEVRVLLAQVLPYVRQAPAALLRRCSAGWGGMCVGLVSGSVDGVGPTRR